MSALEHLVTVAAVSHSTDVFSLFAHFVIYREQLAPRLDGLMGLKGDSLRDKDITGFSSCLVWLMI